MTNSMAKKFHTVFSISFFKHFLLMVMYVLSTQTSLAMGIKKGLTCQLSQETLLSYCSVTRIYIQSELCYHHSLTTVSYNTCIVDLLRLDA